MPKPALWFTFGSLPNTGKVVVLSVDHPSKPSEEKIKRRAREAFPQNAPGAICETILLQRGRPKLFKKELKIYLRKIGIPEYKLSQMLKQFADETQKALDSQ